MCLPTLLPAFHEVEDISQIERICPPINSETRNHFPPPSVWVSRCCACAVVVPPRMASEWPGVDGRTRKCDAISAKRPTEEGRREGGQAGVPNDGNECHFPAPIFMLASQRKPRQTGDVSKAQLHTAFELCQEGNQGEGKPSVDVC